MEALERYGTSNDLLTFLILFVLLLLTLARILFKHRFDDFFSLFSSGSFLLIKSREHKSLFGFNVLMLIAHILCTALFIFILFRYFTGTDFENPGVILLRIITAYGCFILAKVTVEKIIANIFDLDEFADFYLFHKHSYRNLISLIFLPVAVLLLYTFAPYAQLLYVITGLFFAAILLGFIQTIKKNQGIITRFWFYFILYLCALEIAPYVILYKLITAGKIT